MNQAVNEDEREIQKLVLFHEKIRDRLKPNRYFESKIVVENGRIVDMWIMDKARTREQLYDL